MTEPIQDEEKIRQAIALLGPEDLARHADAIKDGYKDEVCTKCKTVLLAFHHFLRCADMDCPKAQREPNGDRSPSILEQMLRSLENP